MSEPAKDEAELLEQMAMAMAKHFSMNNAPHMSGNPLNRLSILERGRLNNATNAALAAIRAAGWAVVPVEPTGEMFEAGHEEFWEGKGIVDTYRAMIAAAPGAKL